jgi:hypothetical protein
MKLIMHFPPASCYFRILPIYPPQHPHLEHPRPMILPEREVPRLVPIKNLANTNRPSVTILDRFCSTDVGANCFVVVVFMVLLTDSDRWFVYCNYVEALVSVVGGVWLKREAINRRPSSAP